MAAKQVWLASRAGCRGTTQIVLDLFDFGSWQQSAPLLAVCLVVLTHQYCRDWSGRRRFVRERWAG